MASAREKFLKEYAEAKETGTPRELKKVVSLSFYREDGKAMVRYNDSSEVVKVEVSGKEHVYKLAAKAKANAEDLAANFTMSDDYGVFSDSAWIKFRDTFIPRSRKVWA